MPSCSQPSRTLRASGPEDGAILDGRCARRHLERAGRDGRMVPIEQKDGRPKKTLKTRSNHPLESTKRLKILLLGHNERSPPILAKGPSILAMCGMRQILREVTASCSALARSLRPRHAEN